MKMVIISDTSPISNLIQIERLDILQGLFQQIIIPPHVDTEIKALAKFGYSLDSYINADWIIIYTPKNQLVVQQFEQDLDRGEAQAIAICQEIGANLLIIDERLGTKIAKSHGLKTIGLIGCLLEAKKKTIIKAVKPILKSLELQAGFYIGKRLKQYVLQLAGEQI